MKDTTATLESICEQVKQLAAELVSVQPMPSDTFAKLLSIAKPEDELIAEGYKPVSRIGLLWIKNRNESQAECLTHSH